MSKMPSEKPVLMPGERLDDLQRDGLRIIQNPSWFCFGMDAVLLSWFARVEEGQKCLDLGCGNGVIPILMYSRWPGESFTGLEIQPDVAQMAGRSVAWNGIGDKVEIIAGDVCRGTEIFPKASFDVITSNPPYLMDAHGLKNPGDHKAIARHEVACSLKQWIETATKLLKPGGHFYMVHRPFRLAEILHDMVEAKLQPKRMQLVYPKKDKEPNLVLIEGVRGGNSQLTVEPPLIVYDDEGDYMEQIRHIYYD